MITHNGTYLLHATHHGMPIYAATMGGKMVIGWLQSATLQAIVAAFGAEGTEVIRKTNDYLNRIATTDHARAPLLAGFINEDPMLVCSLVETSKTRWLVGDGKAWIDLGKKYGTGAKGILVFKYRNTPINDRNLLAGNGVQFIHYNNYVYYQYGGWNSTSTKFDVGVVYEVETSFVGTTQYMKINGETKKTTNIGTTQTPSTNTCIFNNGTTSNSTEIDVVVCEMYEGEILVQNLIPYNNGTECGMLDIISGTFYPNANTSGSFTIQLTDKTPA